MRGSREPSNYSCGQAKKNYIMRFWRETNDRFELGQANFHIFPTSFWARQISSSYKA